jgi:hypothetical protein
VVELLVGHGGDLCIGERTPLFEACQAGHVDCAKFIVQSLRKSLSLAEIQKDLNEALLCSAEIDSSDLCNLLIDSGAQIVSGSGRHEGCREVSWKNISFLLRTASLRTIELL